MMRTLQRHRFQKSWDMGFVLLIIISSYSLLYAMAWLAERFLYTDIDADRFASAEEIDLFVIGGLAIMILVFYLAVLISTAYVRSLYGMHLKVTDWKNITRKHTTDSILIGVVLGLLSFVSSINVLGRLPEGWVITGPSGNIYFYTPILHFFVIAIASIVEEYFFRGFCYVRLRVAYGVSKSMLYNSLLFTLWHVHNIINEPFLLLVNFASGIAFCWIFEKSKSLLPPVISHVLLNTIIIICSYII